MTREMKVAARCRRDIDRVEHAGLQPNSNIIRNTDAHSDPKVPANPRLGQDGANLFHQHPIPRSDSTRLNIRHDLIVRCKDLPSVHGTFEFSLNHPSLHFCLASDSHTTESSCHILRLRKRDGLNLARVEELTQPLPQTWVLRLVAEGVSSRATVG
jgi:hypothetical protein